MYLRPDVAVRHVRKTFEDGNPPVHALGPISLEVGRGEFVAVLGPSGSGKTTLLRLVGGFIAPTSGDITLTGLSPDEARRAHAYAIVFQRPVLFDWRTVAANVWLPLELAGVSRSEREQRASAALSAVGLAGKEGARPWQLSGGMQQRVGLARAMVSEPQVLLMDEPFASLDEVTRERLEEQLRELCNSARVTVLLVTHDIEEAVFLADRVLVLTSAPGRVAASIAVPLGPDRTSELRHDARYLELVASARHEARVASRSEQR
jgi:NitT/TauT family transport system ATP-binding protein